MVTCKGEVEDWTSNVAHVNSLSVVNLIQRNFPPHNFPAQNLGPLFVTYEPSDERFDRGCEIIALEFG